MQLPSDLHQTLLMVAAAMDHAQDDWWIISSAAVALHGAGPLTVGDVDVLTSVADASRIFSALGIDALVGTGNALFRSDLFGRWCAPPLTVEFMAGFQVCSQRGWTEIWPETRERIDLDGLALFVPTRGELRQIISSFGRPKDIARAALLSV